MPKSVLEYTQNCLSVMDADQVDSIADTEESTQVAELLREVYYDLLQRDDWSYLRRPVQLVAAGDANSPTQFSIPSDVQYIEWIKYDITKPSDPGSFPYKPMPICYIEPDEFLQRQESGSGNKQLVEVGSSIKFYVSTDTMPSFYTSFNDSDLFMDSFASAVETTLTSSRTSCYGKTIPDFTVSDVFIPDIPVHMQQLLQHELNANATLYFKQTKSPVDESERIIQMARMRRTQSKITRSKYYSFSAGRNEGRTQYDAYTPRY